MWENGGEDDDEDPAVWKPVSVCYDIPGQEKGIFGTGAKFPMGGNVHDREWLGGELFLEGRAGEGLIQQYFTLLNGIFNGLHFVGDVSQG